MVHQINICNWGKLSCNFAPNAWEGSRQPTGILVNVAKKRCLQNYGVITHKCVTWHQGSQKLTARQSQDEVDSWVFRDVVEGEGAAILQLLASEDQSLLVNGGAFLILQSKMQSLVNIKWPRKCSITCNAVKFKLPLSSPWDTPQSPWGPPWKSRSSQSRFSQTVPFDQR